MFEVGAKVVDRWLFARKRAAIGIVRSCHETTAAVEWPDGLEETVPLGEIQAV